jgi:hypothetical protein
MRRKAKSVAITGFCTNCRRTVYRGSDDPEYCPVCSDPLLITPEEATSSLEERVVRNEAAFRLGNENQLSAAGGFTGDGSLFHCECGRPDCTEKLRLSRAAYESVRQDPRRFFVVPGHNIDGVEVVAERQPSYWVVEKIGRSGQMAEANNPRRSA